MNSAQLDKMLAYVIEVNNSIVDDVSRAASPQHVGIDEIASLSFYEKWNCFVELAREVSKKTGVPLPDL